MRSIVLEALTHSLVKNHFVLAAQKYEFFQFIAKKRWCYRLTNGIIRRTGCDSPTPHSLGCRAVILWHPQFPVFALQMLIFTTSALQMRKNGLIYSYSSLRAISNIRFSEKFLVLTHPRSGILIFQYGRIASPAELGMRGWFVLRGKESINLQDKQDAHFYHRGVHSRFQ